MPLLGWLKPRLAIKLRVLGMRSALRRLSSRKRAVPQEITHTLRHISLRSRSRRLRAELGNREATEAARWRGAYGISGNRGVSKFTSSARAWPRTRSRRSAGVPPATGLRRADQWPAPAAAAFEALAAAQAMRLKSVKNRIILVCLLGRDLLFEHSGVFVAGVASRSGSTGLDWHSCSE